MRFEFATAGRIIFGSGTISEVPSLAAEMGHRACVVTGRTTERAEPLLGQIGDRGIECVAFNVTSEPTTTLAKEAAEFARRNQCDLVLSIGGGSVLDTGKVVAAMLTNSGELEDYLEVVGAGKALARDCAPHVAIPTTAGTGAEVTRNAVLGVPEHKVKVSMRSALMLPALAVVDPDLTCSMPPSVTASTGLDALTQLIEVYVSNKANPLTDGICREGLVRGGRSLRRAYEDGTDRPAPRGHGPGEPLRRAGPGQCEAGSRARFRRPVRGNVFRCPRCNLRPALAFCHGGKCAGIAQPPGRLAGIGAIRPGSSALDGQIYREGLRRRRVDTGALRYIESPCAVGVWIDARGLPNSGGEIPKVKQHERQSD